MAKDNKSKKLYEFRNKNYNSNSPHYAELSKLIKHGDKAALVEFGATVLVPQGETYDEFADAVDARYPEGEKAPRSEQEDDADVDVDL